MLLQYVQKFCSSLADTLASMAKVAILSRPETVKAESGAASLVVLGNGPSLRTLLENNFSFLDGRDRMVVNFSSVSQDFVRIAPRYYLLMDPAFFENAETMHKVFEPMAEKVTWKMTLFVPTTARKRPGWLPLVKRNILIEVQYFNPTPIEGFKAFRRFAYRAGWGMPRPRNVLVACLMVSLKLPYSTIYLAGADHSWLKEIWVDDNNVVQEDRAHFYDKKGTSRVTSPHRLYVLLESMSIAFRSYLEVEDYARERGTKIYNITEGSYIDAFERYKIQ